MSDESEDAASDSARLEAALDRIARATARLGSISEGGSGAQDAIVASQVAARLDSLIARLRATLGDVA